MLYNLFDFLENIKNIIFSIFWYFQKYHDIFQPCHYGLDWMWVWIHMVIVDLFGLGQSAIVDWVGLDLAKWTHVQRCILYDAVHLANWHSVFVDRATKWTLNADVPRVSRRRRCRRHSLTVSPRCTCACRCRRRRCRSRASAPSTTDASLSSSRSPASSSNFRRRRRLSSTAAKRPCPTSTSRFEELAVICSCRSRSCRSCALLRDLDDKTMTLTSPYCHSASLRPIAHCLVSPGYRLPSPHFIPSRISCKKTGEWSELR